MTRRRPIRDLDKNAQANSDSAPEDSPDLQVAAVPQLQIEFIFSKGHATRETSPRHDADETQVPGRGESILWRRTRVTRREDGRRGAGDKMI